MNKLPIGAEIGIKRKNKKIAFWKRLIFLITILTLSLFVIYYWYEGELQFLGQKTEQTKATIIDTKMHHIGHGKYMQKVTYQFEYKRKKYLGSFEAGVGLGKQRIGKKIKVKFSTTNPNRSRMLVVYKGR